MRYKTKFISPGKLFKIIKKLVKRNNLNKRGRPKKYLDYYIISILVVMKIFNLSYREVINFLEDYFPKKQFPAISTLCYKIKTIDKRLLEYIISSLGKDILKAYNKVNNRRRII